MSGKVKITFNRPYIAGSEFEFVKQAIDSGRLSGNNPFSRKCHEFIESSFNIKKALLTSSGTDALEMATLILDIDSGDEVILPSYTFSSTANAVCLRGAKPVFVDIRQDTLNIDENKIEEAITDRTKVIFPVHYGGISAEMDKINEMAKKYSLYVIEDAAQGVDAKYNGKALGSLGDLGAYSFHDSKNIICGEGGAFLINNEEFIERAEILWEKGTDRTKVIRGEKDKYSWVDLGSSFLLSDILAAFLYAQLLCKDKVKQLRKKIYDRYYNELLPLEKAGLIQLPFVPESCEPNYHSFFILLRDERTLTSFLCEMREKMIGAYIGYVPLHISRMGRNYGYSEGDLPVTEAVGKRIARMPFYTDMSSEEQEYVIGTTIKVVKSIG